MEGRKGGGRKGGEEEEREQKKEGTLKGSSRIPESNSFSPSAELETMHFLGGLLLFIAKTSIK